MEFELALSASSSAALASPSAASASPSASPSALALALALALDLEFGFGSSEFGVRSLEFELALSASASALALALACSTVQCSTVQYSAVPCNGGGLEQTLPNRLSGEGLGSLKGLEAHHTCRCLVLDLNRIDTPDPIARVVLLSAALGTRGERESELHQQGFKGGHVKLYGCALLELGKAGKSGNIWTDPSRRAR